MFSSNVSARKLLAGATIAGLTFSFAIPATVGAASKTRTSGNGESVDLSWTEYDPDDLLGLPGNVHVGYLYAYSGPYGSYIAGNVTDFDCDEGETPWGGGHHAVIVDEAAETVNTAIEDAVDASIDAGDSAINFGDVLDAVLTDLSTEVPDVIVDEIENGGGCDYIQDRFLNGDGTATFSVNSSTQVARITGTLVVSNGGHGEPGTVLGNPPVDVTITGGDWSKYEYSSTYEGQNYKYSDWSKGTSYYGGDVTGGIGAMGFADDVDDESWGGFGTFRFKTSERIR